MKRLLMTFLGIIVLMLEYPLAAGIDEIVDGKDFQKLSPKDFKRLKADSWRVVGKNILVSGHVYLPLPHLEIYTDRMVVNLEGRDFEASGNIRLLRWQEASGAVTLDRLAELEKMSDCRVEILGTEGDLWGDYKIKVKVFRLTDSIRAGRLTGNLDSGYFRFDDLKVKYLNFVLRAGSGERAANGVITVKDAEISGCEYLVSNNAHYSFSAKEAKLRPHDAEFFGLDELEKSPGQYSVEMYNSLVKIYGVPFFYLPYFYKPKDQSPGLFSVHFGKNNDWGYYLNMSKKFQFSDYPFSSVKVMTDLYSKRGVGLGADALFATERSRTEVFFYNIYDLNTDEGTDYSKLRMDVPDYRFALRANNVTHITPYLDFRGEINYFSDPFFERDFFRDRYNANPSPGTFVALEQQFEHFSTSLYTNFQLNRFYTTVEKLPEFRIETPRQQILNTGLYHQGSFSISNFRMNWLHFDEPIKNQKLYSDLEDYRTFRTDTTHFLYYPIKNRYFNLVPRAGFKLTNYSRTSDRDVSTNDLYRMMQAARITNDTGYLFRNYDSNGGNQTRFVGELGVELSTKIHNTWQNVRSYAMDVDGLRHILQPYVNYTYISDPNVKRENIYYFDNIDRITEQNFIRIGMENTLQTRRNGTVQELFYMENFWDYHFNSEEDLSHIGDFGTRIRLQLLRGLSINGTLLVDAGGNNRGREDLYISKHGLNADWINELRFGVNYSPMRDVAFNFNYNLVRNYYSRSAYSMGSTLTQIDSGSVFERFMGNGSESFSLGVRLPLTPSHRTIGSFRLAFDSDDGQISDFNFSLLQKFHCFSIVAQLGFSRNDGDGYDNGDWEPYYSMQLNMDSLSAPMGQYSNDILAGVDRNSMTGSNFTF